MKISTIGKQFWDKINQYVLKNQFKPDGKNGNRQLIKAVKECNDVDEYYIIIGRCTFNLGMSPNHYATIIEKDGIFILDYQFNVKG